ncbi:AAA family ATPase [Azospirillum sp. TSO5]|uniref:ATP-dependent DNA helicase n=1 Tax=Azospirillum sp. TSO5 TaxID=716760 RepID=UPI001304D2CB|nr:AAA family ATPase [Azospirillum sp. TSO5]
MSATNRLTLSSEQEEALRIIQETIDGAMAISRLYGGAEIVLQGFAGTGKTFSVQELVLRNPRIPIVLTAPTNKAVKVLVQKNRAAGLDTPCMTIYKLLGVKPGNSDEKRSLKKDGRDSSQDFRIVIIDECSMLNSEMMTYIRRMLNRHIVIYVGDPKQLPPVGEDLSVSFNTERRAVLSTIMRQRDENPIIALTADIRGMIDTGVIDWDAFAPATGSDGSGIYRADGNLDAWVLDGFLSQTFRDDNDAFRYLAWTNNTVANVNKMVRAAVYGENAPPFVEGERLLFRRPVMQVQAGRPVTVFSTDEEAVVQRVEATTGPRGVPVWALDMKNDEDVRGEVLVVREDGRDFYNALEYELKNAARADRSNWPAYFLFTEQFSEVQSVYAMTVHRSQGSTFGTVFVDLPDISKNRGRPQEMAKLLYVAASRPSRFLVI